MHVRFSVQFSHWVVCDSLQPHESQHARPPCPSPTAGVHSDSRPSSQWCHPAISSSGIFVLFMTNLMKPWFSYLGLIFEARFSIYFSSVAQSCRTLCDPMNPSTPGLPVHHQLLEFTQTHVHQVSDAIQPSHLLLSPSPPAPNPSQHQSLFQWVNSSHEVAKVLEFQL